MEKILSNKAFIKAIIIAAIIALAITIHIGQGAKQNFYWNTLLVNITFMGDAFFAFGFSFSFLFFLKKKSFSLKLLLTIILTLVIIQFVKNIFSGLSFQLFFENGIVQNSHEAFYNKNIISSHTAIAFTLAGFFILHTKNNYFKILCIMLASFVAFTRVALAADSLITVLFGLLPAMVSIFYAHRLKTKNTRSQHSYYYKSKKETNSSSPYLLKV